MPQESDVIRAAVQAALANDSVIEAGQGAQGSPSSIQDTPFKKKRKGKSAAQKKKTRETGLDSNWKKLQKAIAKPGKKPRAKRPRKVDIEKTKQTESQTTKKDNKLSAFMKRRVTETDEVSRVIAIDCEMVGVGPGGKENALARVSLVNYAGDVLYDTLVRVHEPVTDYRTEFSGIRPGDVSATNPAAVEPLDAQRTVGELIRGRVLVGHAIRNDLTALRLKHPWRDVRDTAEYYRRLWRRTKNRRSAKPPALRTVVAAVLGVDAFQKEEHDSCEDARAALMLYKRNAKDWEAELRSRRSQAKKGAKSKAKVAVSSEVGDESERVGG